MTVPAIIQAIEKRRDTIVSLLPDRAQQERFMSALITHVGPRRELWTPALQESLIVSLYTVAKLGLDPGVDCYLIPRSGTVRCEIGYKGAVKIMLRVPGATHVHTFLIYQNERYRIERGHVVMHEASLDVVGRGKLVAAVAQLYLRDGSCIERIVDEAEIDVAKRMGQGAWRTAEGEMWRKTALLRLAKIVPLDSLTSAAIAEIEQATITPVESPKRFTSAQPTRLTLPSQTAPTQALEADTSEEADPWHE